LSFPKSNNVWKKPLDPDKLKERSRMLGRSKMEKKEEEVEPFLPFFVIGNVSSLTYNMVKLGEYCRNIQNVFHNLRHDLGWL